MNGYAKHCGYAQPQYDVVIIGAGISGINMGYRIQTNFPHLSYCILEGRDAIGGTWDLFRYPGIRSDSDLFTFGFQWYPWKSSNPIASGESIRSYLQQAVSRFDIDKQIRFQHHVKAASWSSADQQWKLEVKKNEQDAAPITARFVVFGTGYYDFETPLQAHIPGLDSFQGQVVHPQFWPEDLDYSGKKVTVIGSGATAITLLPKLAEKASLATMLQRSPTYILPLPNSKTSSWVDYLVPEAITLRLRRLRWIFGARMLFLLCTWFPNAARAVLKLAAKRRLPKDVPHDPHFNPTYNPWEQRLCISPDGDFYDCLHTGRAEVVTDTIRNVTETGIETSSGKTIDADIIVTATGLKLSLAGGISLTVDGIKTDLGSKFIWNGSMVQDMPNSIFVIGYTNASWTLGADATASMVVRLLRTLQQKKCTSVCARLQHPDEVKEAPLLNLKSTYIKEAKSIMPKSGETGPWRPRTNYLVDDFKARHGSLQGLEWVS